MCRFNEIKTSDDLADFLNFPPGDLTDILYVKRPESYYRTFEIPKKSGGTRRICAPCGNLKKLQRNLADRLLEYQERLRQEKGRRNNISHGFEKGKDIISNSKIHKNKRYVLNLDLQDFFESFHFGRVQGYFEKNRDFLLPHEVSVIIAQIACYNGRLPQGAPSSPVITNLICQILDMHILKIAKKYKLDYTRYADDLTFSTNYSGFLDSQEAFMKELSSEIEHTGFAINDKKTRLLFKNSRQEVTGLVVNKKVNVNRTYIKKTRAMAHQLYTRGEFTIDGVPGDIKQLEGRFAFINRLDTYNNRGFNHNRYSFCGHEKQYQAFLFYKYFYSIDSPLILTEGKTDIRYLKAALQNRFQDYPTLIKKNDEGEFVFKVQFFHSTKRLETFFGLSLAKGADTMKNLYNYFFDVKDNPNYYAYFSKKSVHKQKSPVILLYDNETKTERPLKIFLDHAKISKKEKNELQEQLYFRLKQNKKRSTEGYSNPKFFLLTIPLPSKEEVRTGKRADKDECEIEDLFTPEQLNLKIGGKSFSREKEVDREKHYDKNFFSNYVLAHYKEIDFTGFVPLLDALAKIIEEAG